MPGLTGHSTVGVGNDIVQYLEGVARHFGVTIRVTSGYRSPDRQAQAMFDNWAKLEHGKVYRASTLPPADRATLDNYWATAHNHQASAQERAQARDDFLALAKDRVGSRSMHTRGRAVDVSRDQINSQVYQAITLRLREVKEGNRTDIYHFESADTVPPVDGTTKAQWQAGKSNSSGTSPGDAHQGHTPRRRRHRGHRNHGHAHHGQAQHGHLHPGQPGCC